MNRTIGRIVGALFLVAFVCYGVSAALMDHPLGTALILMNSTVVVMIGVLVFEVLRRQHPVIAVIYLMTRAIEAALLAMGVVLFASIGSADGNSVSYQLAMLTLGIGSVLFCRALLNDGLVPGWLAVWGIVGYIGLAAGAVLELLGLTVGLVLSIPGGLFEVVLGLILIARGFLQPTDASPSRNAELAHSSLAPRA